MQQATQTDASNRYAPSAAGRKVSFTVDEETLRLVRELAQYRGLSVSAWLARATRYQVQVDDGLRAVDEYIAEEGPFTEEDIRKADDWLDAIGIRRIPD